MTRRGRPLRFLALTAGGWIGLRVLLLWPTGAPPLPAIVRELAHPAAAIAAAVALHPPQAVAPAEPWRGPVLLAEPEQARPSKTVAAAATPSLDPPADRPAFLLALASASLVRFGEAIPAEPSEAAQPRALAPRLRGSGWSILRGGGGSSGGAPFASQLGGSQAGTRVTYALGDGRRVALSGRLSTAIGQPQREAAVGLDWQPTALPVHLVAEQRIAFDRGRGGPAVGLIGGLPPIPIAGGFRLEGYAQAGAIARGGVEGFADGALRLARPAATLGGATVDLGLGTWGGAQRAAARLDVGPSLGVSTRIGDRSLRLTLDWRQRVAGSSQPGSGPALSIGTDF